MDIKVEIELLRLPLDQQLRDVAENIVIIYTGSSSQP